MKNILVRRGKKLACCHACHHGRVFDKLCVHACVGACVCACVCIRSSRYCTVLHDTVEYIVEYGV